MELEEIAAKNNKYFEQLNQLKTGVELYQKKLAKKIEQKSITRVHKEPLSFESGLNPYPEVESLIRGNRSDLGSNPSAGLTASKINEILNRENNSNLVFANKLNGENLFQKEEKHRSESNAFSFLTNKQSYVFEKPVKENKLSNQIDELLFKVNHQKNIPVKAYQKHFQLIENLHEDESFEEITPREEEYPLLFYEPKQNPKQKLISIPNIPKKHHIKDKYSENDFVLSSDRTSQLSDNLIENNKISYVYKENKKNFPPLSNAVDRSKNKLKEMIEEKKKISIEISEDDKEIDDFELSEDDEKEAKEFINSETQLTKKMPESKHDKEEFEERNNKLVIASRKKELLIERKKLLTEELENIEKQIEEMENDMI